MAISKDNHFNCAECGQDILDEDTVWIDQVTLEASTGDEAKPYHVECAPAQHNLLDDFGYFLGLSRDSINSCIDEVLNDY